MANLNTAQLGLLVMCVWMLLPLVLMIMLSSQLTLIKIINTRGVTPALCFIAYALLILLEKLSFVPGGNPRFVPGARPVPPGRY